jgi:hypothetical protein
MPADALCSLSERSASTREALKSRLGTRPNSPRPRPILPAEMSSRSIPNTSPFPVLSTSEGPLPSLNPLPQRNHQQWAPRRVRPPLRALAMRPRELAISPDELSPHAATMLLLQQADLQATSANQIPSPRSSTRKRRAIQPRAVHPPAQLTWVPPTVSANRQASRTDPKAQDWKFVTKAPKSKSCKTATILLPRHAGLEAPSSNPNRIRSTRLSSRRRCTVE